MRRLALLALLLPLVALGACEDDIGLAPANMPDAALSDAALSDAALSDAAADAPHDADADATAAAFDLFVDPLNGIDTGDGSAAHPVRTLAHASALAKSGQTIGLLDGTFTEGTSFTTCQALAVRMPPGVTVRAVHPQAAIFSNIDFGTTSGALTIFDVVLDGGANGACTSISATDAMLTLSGVSFRNQSHLDLGGAAKATIVPGSLGGASMIVPAAGLGTAPSYFVTMSGTSALTITGGLLDQGPDTTQCGNPLINVNGAAKLTLDGVTVKNTASTAVNVTGAASLVNHTLLDHVGYAAGCSAGLLLNYQATLNMTDSVIQGSASGAIGLRPGGLGTAAVITSSQLKDSAYGIIDDVGFASGPTSITLTNSQVTGMSQQGLSLAPSGDYPQTVAITGSKFGTDATAIRFTATTGSTVSIANSTISGTSTGFSMDGTAPIRVVAHGNTWHPGVQGADASGHYVNGTIVDATSAPGTNYQITGAGSIDL